MSFQKMQVLGLVSLLIVSGFAVVVGSSRNTKLEMGKTKNSNGLYAGGSGTKSDRYQISNVKQLQNINENLDDHYKLVKDINASETENWNSGKGFSPIGGESNSFTGTLDGQGHKITNLSINNSNKKQVGLFGSIATPIQESASISNLTLISSEVSGDGECFVGSLVGTVGTKGTVTNCSASGKAGISSSMRGEPIGEDWGIIGGLVGGNWGDIHHSHAVVDTKGGPFNGGLVGKNHEGEIISSFSIGNVKANFKESNFTGYGGLVGYNNGGTVNNSYAAGDVVGTSGVGGLIGYNNGEVLNSYAVGRVKGNKNVGGLIGYGPNYLVRNTFWNIDTTGQSSSTGGTGKTTAEMKDIDTFTDTSTESLTEAWDFAGDPNDDDGNRDIWKIDESGQINDGYPYLKGRGGYSDKDVTGKGGSENGMPGLTTIALLASISLAALYIYRKK